MAAVDDLQSADTLHISGVSFHFSQPLASFDSVAGPFCVAKPAGQLAFTLTSEELGLPVSGLSFPFTGTPDGSDAVIWSVDESVNVSYKGAQITHVSGHVRTIVSPMAGTDTSTCDGTASRIDRATLATVMGGSDQITVSVNVGDAHITNISLAGTAGQVLAPISFDVSIHEDHWSSDGCGRRYNHVGDMATFTALLENLSVPDPVIATTFTWTLPDGSTHTGDSVSWTFTAEGNFRVSVDAEVETSREHGEASAVNFYTVLSEDEARLASLICKLRHEVVAATLLPGVGPGVIIGGHRFVDPLWDPLPFEGAIAGVVNRQYTTAELRRIERASALVGRTSGELAAQAREVLEQREALAGPALQGRANKSRVPN